MSSVSSRFMPADRLVEQQQLRLHGQRAAELDALLHAVGQQADRQPAPRLQLEEVDDVLDPRPVRDLLAAGPAEPGDGGQRAVARCGGAGRASGCPAR